MLRGHQHGNVFTHVREVAKVERGNGSKQHHRRDCTLRRILHLRHNRGASHETEDDLTEREEDRQE